MCENELPVLCSLSTGVMEKSVLRCSTGLLSSGEESLAEAPYVRVCSVSDSPAADNPIIG
jgi:hypothetical protein